MMFSINAFIYILYRIKTQITVALLHILKRILKIKVLDRLIAKGFLGPCLLAFFVVEFVLIMQYMWKIIDDILGQGYGAWDYMELLYYFSVVLIPMSLPLTVLLASVMVYGDMAEKHELSSLKSSGVSLLRTLMPGMAIAIGIALFSVFASNNLKPRANAGFMKKVRMMKTNKLTFVFDEKIFNKDFRNYSIRIEQKEKDGRTIKGALIYDLSDGDKSIVNVIYAKNGEMYTTPDQKYLVMDLKDGYHFKEIRSESADNRRKNFKLQGRPLLRYNFATLRKVFDLEKLMDLSMANINYKKYETLNSDELLSVIDSLKIQIHENKDRNPSSYMIFRTLEKDTMAVATLKPNATIGQVPPQKINRIKVNRRPLISKKFELHLNQITAETKRLSEVITILKPIEYYKKTKKSNDSLKMKNSNNRHEDRRLQRDLSLHTYVLHRMYSWAMVCIIFLFVGAPAGALVRKGGFGYPMLIAIGFYLTFIMTNIIGEKLTRSGDLEGWQGAWLPCLILLPFAIYLTWRALHDRKSIVNWPDLKRLFQHR